MSIFTAFQQAWALVTAVMGSNGETHITICTSIAIICFLKRRNSLTHESAGRSASLWQKSENERDSPITHSNGHDTREKVQSADLQAHGYSFLLEPSFLKSFLPLEKKPFFFFSGREASGNGEVVGGDELRIGFWSESGSGVGSGFGLGFGSGWAGGFGSSWEELMGSRCSDDSVWLTWEKNT